MDVITNEVRSDGFGSQYQKIIYSIIYAELNGFKFEYSPLINVEHNYDNEVDFVKNKEILMNLLGNFDIYSGKGSSIDSGTTIKFFEDNFEKCIKSDSYNNIKKLFKLNKTNPFKDSKNTNIAVHIRRFNKCDHRLYGSHINTNIYLQIISYLRTIYKGCTFHIYSQGSIDQFEELKYNDVTFHLNESIEKTFTEFVFADVLVLGTSSFSYTAGLLSDGIIYYIPYLCHPPVPGWAAFEFK